MCKRRFRLVSSGAVALALAAAWPAAGQMAAGQMAAGQIAAGQTAAELAARRDSLESRYAVARQALEMAENLARAVPDDSLVLHGSVVQFNAANLEERERRSLRRAFDAAAAELTELFGPAGVSLLSEQRWLVTVMHASSRRVEPSLVLEAVNAEPGPPVKSLSLPLNVPLAADVIRRQAGRNLLRSQPRLRDWLGGAFLVSDRTTTHYYAHRQLALHQSSPARRCARGNIIACTDILDSSARARWFDPGDEANPDRVPASGLVRESVLRYAVDFDGPALLRAVTAEADSTMEPLEFIAAAVGQPQEEFLAGWQAQLAASGAVRVRAPARNIATALAWFAVCGIVAARRRPQ